MRRKSGGYIFQFTASDHGGRHIHVFRDNRPVGVYDRVDGPVRGLDRANSLTSATSWIDVG